MANSWPRRGLVPVVPCFLPENATLSQRNTSIAAILTNVTGRQVKYKDSSIKMFAKAAKALGASEFEIAQIRYYAEELRHGAFETGAPTDHVELVTGRKPETFESIARRYIANPTLIHPKLANGGKLAAMGFVFRMMFSRVPDFDQWERERGFPILTEPVLAHESDEWQATAQMQELNLLPVAQRQLTELSAVS